MFLAPACRLYTTTPKSKGEFWRLKFEGNLSRDVHDIALLRQAGWRVAIVWECALNRSMDDVVATVDGWIQSHEEELAVE